MTDRSRLRQFIIDYFSDEELTDLTFDYFPEVNRIYASGMTKGQKVRELIDFADRHGRMSHLTTALEKARPESYCEFFAVEYEEPPELRTHERDPRQIFVSFAAPDIEFGNRLAANLREAGYEVWIASDSIQPGEKWVDAINRGLMESGIFLLLLTPDAVNSRWVYDETSVAIALENKEQIRILMLRVRDADVPPLWSIRQHISFEDNYDQGLGELLAALQSDAAGISPAAISASAPAGKVGRSPAFALMVDWPDRPNEERTLAPVTTIGRAADNDIVLDFPFVADHHLRLETQEREAGQQVRAIDLGSETGTMISGRPMPSNEGQWIEPGDVISLGFHSDIPINLSLRALAGPSDKAGGLPVAAAAQAAAGAPAKAGSAGSKQPPVWVYGLIGVLIVGLIGFLVLSRGGRDGDGSGNTAAQPSPTGAREVAVVAPVETATDAPTEEPTDKPTDEPSPTAEPSSTASPPATATSAPPSPTAEPAATDEPTAEPSPTTPPAEPAPIDAAIYFTSDATLYAANPEWPEARAIGETSSNSCFAGTIATGGATHSLQFGPYCDIRGDSAVCPSPDGTRELLVTASGSTRTLEVRRPGGRRTFVFQGPIKISEGIRWSPTSSSYLFVDDRETIYRGLATGGYGTILRSAYAPQYSADGLQLLFARVSLGGVRDVFISNTDGSGVVNVSNLGLQDLDCPRWAAPK